MKNLFDYFNALYVRLVTPLRDEKGQGLVEYALIIVLIALVAILAMKYLGQAASNTLSNAASTISNP